jgi:heme-degrading monooxygenase HmoA
MPIPIWNVCLHSGDSLLEYCLRISVPPGKASSYENWLKDHAQAVTNLSGFVSCQILSGPSLDHNNTTMFHVRYVVESEESFEAYLKGPAQKMRQEGVDMFGSFVTIQRDLIKLKHHLTHQGES